MLAALACLAWPVASLELRDQKGRPRLTATLAEGQEVELGFIHSWYQVPQKERYLWRRGRLELVSVFFGSFDALDYYDPLAVYPRRKVPGGFQVVMDPPIELPVRFALGHQTKLWLRLAGDRVIDLNRLCPQGKGFTLKVAGRPRFMAWIKEATHGRR